MAPVPAPSARPGHHFPPRPLPRPLAQAAASSAARPGGGAGGWWVPPPGPAPRSSGGAEERAAPREGEGGERRAARVGARSSPVPAGWARSRVGLPPPAAVPRRGGARIPEGPGLGQEVHSCTPCWHSHTVHVVWSCRAVKVCVLTGTVLASFHNHADPQEHGIGGHCHRTWNAGRTRTEAKKKKKDKVRFKLP